MKCRKYFHYAEILLKIRVLEYRIVIWTFIKNKRYQVVLDKQVHLKPFCQKTDIQSSCLKVSGPMNDDDIAYIREID